MGGLESVEQRDGYTKGRLKGDRSIEEGVSRLRLTSREQGLRCDKSEAAPGSQVFGGMVEHPEEVR